MKRALLTAIVISILPGFYVASALAQSEKSFHASYVDVPPTIDGKLTDKIWVTAPIIDDFHQVRPIEFDPPGEKVKVRVLYDQHFLYVAADIEMNDIGDMTAFKLAQGTSGFQDDIFAVIIDPYNKQRSGYQFSLNANGVRQEGIFDGPGGLNNNWNGIWNGQTKRQQQGWTAELAIPFKTLNFDSNNDTWGISFSFKVFKHDETIAWTSENREVQPGTLGAVSGITRAQQGRGLDLVLSGSVNHSRNFVLDHDDTEVDPSIDLFYKVTPALTAALTINTDFSATEVDDRVVNLDRFSVFFPEKRAFFLQDADIFSFGGLRGSGNSANPNGIPFFSRRIGLDENTEPIDINVGGKLTGRIGPFNVGVLGVQQQGLVDDVNLFVGRATMNVLEESSIGIIVTDGSPVESESNTLYGVDFNYLNREALAGKSLRSQAWYQQSDTDAMTGDDSAYGLTVNVPQTDGFFGGVRFVHIGDNFSPALGFVNRSAIREYEISAGHKRYPRTGNWQFWTHETEFTHVENLDGNVESQALELQFFQTGNRTQDWFTLRAFREREVITEPFEISNNVFIDPGDYRWNRIQASVSSGEQRKLYSTTTISYGDFYDGSRLQINGNMTWQPSMHFSTDFGYNFNDIELDSGSFISRLYSMRTIVAFNSKWSWITLAQWDNGSNVLGVNTRLKWIPQPGRDVTFVANHGTLVEDESDPLARKYQSLRSDIVLKASYTFRF